MATLRTAADFSAYLASIGVSLPFDEEVQSGPDSSLAQPCRLGDRTIGNRFSVHPMEGWDGATDGCPTDLTRRRWQRFGLTGAKLIWGGEAVAVRPDGRSNPHQLMLLDHTVDDIAELRASLVRSHEECFGQSDDLLVGVQLTHSGRKSHPNVKLRREPTILYHHPAIDAAFDVDPDLPVMTDDDVAVLVTDFVRAGALARRAGFDFAEIKLCHGYLGHEFLNAVTRPGRYGGTFENRTRFFRETVEGIRSAAPGLELAVRLSAFDFVPHRIGADGQREPLAGPGVTPPFLFGSDQSGVGIDLTEPFAFLDLLEELGIRLLGVSAGGISGIGGGGVGSWLRSPPAQDPLIGVARLIDVAAEVKNRKPGLLTVGTGYSYLQEWFPNVAQYQVRTGRTDSVGIGRLALSCPEVVSDVLGGRPLQRKRLCRACGACSVAPQYGMISGCYALDPFFRARPEYARMVELRKTG